MKRFAAVILLGVLSVGWSLPASAQLQQNGMAHSREARKAEKKQTKAQRKYAKAQRKAEKKMLKKEKKGTKYPARQI